MSEHFLNPFWVMEKCPVRDCPPQCGQQYVHVLAGSAKTVEAANKMKDHFEQQSGSWHYIIQINPV